MSVHDIEQRVNIRVVKGNGSPKTADDYMRDHELGILSLLIRRHPERAREIIKKLAESKRLEAA